MQMKLQGNALYIGNDNVVEVDALRDGLKGPYINNAVVACGVFDDDGNPVGGLSFPVPLDYVEGSNGKYRAILDKALDIEKNEFYTVIIDVTALGGLDAHWELRVQGLTRIN